MAKIHLIGNAHLDPVWLWRWQEGFSEVIATFRSALDRMKDFPDFKFTSACAVYYQWIEQIDPQMFEEIKQRVKEGRWCIVGGWFLQPDCNMPSGESFARHSLIGQRYFKEKFGITAGTGYNVDSFGHNPALPKILKASRMDNYVFMRPQPEEKDIKESTFMWESDDGSRVCTFRVPWYYEFGLDRMELFTRLRRRADEEGADYMAFYGVGDHGGGPTIRLIEEINKLPLGDCEYSTPDTFFAQTDKSSLPVVRDELQHHAVGCYTACSQVKRSNRQCENNLIAAESLACMAKHLVGSEYPAAKLTRGWKNVLFNQFHDILCGCCIEPAYEDAGYLFGETMSITEQAINLAVQRIAYNIDTLQGEELPAFKLPQRLKIWEHEKLGTPFVVFNPHPFEVSRRVNINMDALKVTDEKGEEIPFQQVRGDQTNGDKDKYHTAFIACVPPLGYRVYRLFATKEAENKPEKTLSITDDTMENQYLSVRFDRQTGEICDLTDKRTGKKIIDKACLAVLLNETDCDTWAHKKAVLGVSAGSFTYADMQVLEDGDVSVTLRVTQKYGSSTLQRDYTLDRDSTTLRVKAKVLFLEKHRTLKLAFPIQTDRVRAAVPFGTFERPAAEQEEMCHSFIASGDLCVANTGKYGYDCLGGYMRLSILRSAIYADHYGARDEHCVYMEQGEHCFEYAIYPFEGSTAAWQKANALNSPLRTIYAGFHKGSLPEKYSGFHSKNQNIVVTAIKQREGEKGDVIRFFDAEGTDSTVELNLFGMALKTHLKHHGIKTMCTDGTELDLVEWEAGK